MVMYGGVLLYIGVYGYVLRCMVMYRGVWLCMECMVMYRGVWLCMEVYGDV